MIGHDPHRLYSAAIIGAGSGGLTVAVGLAGMGHEVVLVEAGAIGGDCTNVGCIPSKVLLHAARTGHDDPLKLVRSRRDDLAELETAEMENHPKIHLVRGSAAIEAPSADKDHTVRVTGPDGTASAVSARHVVIAAGARPRHLTIPGLPAERMLTNENLFEIEAIPSSLVIVGGGPIGVEMATAFSALGTRVEIVEAAPRVLLNEDPEASHAVTAALVDRGVTIHVGVATERYNPDTKVLHLDDGTSIDSVDAVLVAIGRLPRLEGIGLEATEIVCDTRGIVIDDWGRTSVPGIWAVGDITGRTLTTHGANAIGRRVTRAIALPPLARFERPRLVPNAVFSDPEVASVGLDLAILDERPTRSRLRLRVPLSEVDRGYVDGIRYGVVVVDVERLTGRILRATVVGPSAAEMIGIITLAMERGVSMHRLFGMAHPYPSYARAFSQIADEFVRETYPHIPREVGRWLAGRVLRR